MLQKKATVKFPYLANKGNLYVEKKIMAYAKTFKKGWLTKTTAIRVL